MKQPTILLGLIVSLLASAAFGQSLSMLQKGASEFQVSGSAPAGTPHVLQASDGFGLWVDILDELRTGFTHRFDPEGAERRFFRLKPAVPAADPIRVVLIGDSTVSDICGWGQGIYGYFKPNATVINYAYPWTSTRVFLRSIEMDKMVAVKPDYVIMEFGYVDANSLDTTQTTTLEQYAANLKTIANMIRGWNGTPIMVNLHAPRAWDAQGNVDRSWFDRSVTANQVATELKIPFVDLRALTEKLYRKLGDAGTKYMESECFPNETMHFSLKGGQVISQLVVRSLPPELGRYLTPAAFDPRPKP